MRKRMVIWAVMILLVLSVFAVGASHIFAAAGAAGVQYNYTSTSGGVSVFNPCVPGYEQASGPKGMAGVVYNYTSGPVSIYNPCIPGYETLR
jgi:hypothetical protein